MKKRKEDINFNKKIEGFNADKYGNIKREYEIKRSETNDKFINKLENSNNKLTKFILALLDYILIAYSRIINSIFTIFFKDGILFFNSSDKEKHNSSKITKNKLKYSYNYFNYSLSRYVITILAPPIGIFLSKGLHGWVNILLSIIFCYINYILGIIYSLVIIQYNQYADLYLYKEQQDIVKFKKELLEEGINIDERRNNIKVILIIIVLLAIIILALLYFFNKK